MESDRFHKKLASSESSKAERYMETEEYKRERLHSLTGIEDEQSLLVIYHQFSELLTSIGLDNLEYRRNTVDDRDGIETEFAIKHLSAGDLEEVEAVLNKLRIFGFPEPQSP